MFSISAVEARFEKLVAAALRWNDRLSSSDSSLLLSFRDLESESCVFSVAVPSVVVLPNSSERCRSIVDAEIPWLAGSSGSLSIRA